MINPINFTSANTNAFSPLQSSGESFAITTPYTDSQKKEYGEEKKKKSHKFGIGIATAGVSAGLVIFIASRFFSKKSNLNVNKLFKSAEEKVATIKSKTNISTIDNLRLKGLMGFKRLLNRSKAFFTFATLKDVPFKKLLKQVPGLREFSEGTTNLFKRISIMTLNNSYKATNKEFGRMFEAFDAANNQLPKNLSSNLRERTNLIRNLYNDGFGKAARTERLNTAEGRIQGIDDEVWKATWGDIKEFVKNPDTYKKFIAEDLAFDAKDKFNKEINAAKIKITLRPSDSYKTTNSTLKVLDLAIDLTDKTSNELLTSLKGHLSNYKKEIFSGIPSKGFPKEDVLKDLDQLEEYFKTPPSTYNQETTQTIVKSIKELQGILRSDKEGEIQEILKAYKQHLPADEYTKLQALSRRALSSLDYSTDLEGDKLFDKIRDLKLGSAIHDVFALFGSLGAVGWYVAKADDKDERISATLKYGIPAVGAVSIALLCTVGLIASGPSLIIGGVSGLAINKVGEFIDKKRKENKDNV